MTDIINQNIRDTIGQFGSDENITTHLSDLSQDFQKAVKDVISANNGMPRHVHEYILDALYHYYNEGFELGVLCIYTVYCDIFDPINGHYMSNGISIWTIPTMRAIVTTCWPSTIMKVREEGYDFITGELKHDRMSWSVIMMCNHTRKALELSGSEISLWNESLVFTTVCGVLKSQERTSNMGAYLRA